MEDYTAVNRVFLFSFSSHQQCVDISVVNINVFESFYVIIATSANRVVLDPIYTILQIVENDGKIKGGREGGEKERKEGKPYWWGRIYYHVHADHHHH